MYVCIYYLWNVWVNVCMRYGMYLCGRKSGCVCIGKCGCGNGCGCGCGNGCGNVIQKNVKLPVEPIYLFILHMLFFLFLGEQQCFN